MSPEPIEDRKRVLRANARGLRPERLELAAGAAQRRLLELPELSLAETVVLYAGALYEVPTDTLVGALRARGVRLLFPRVEGSALRLFVANDLEELVPGYRGIREPASDGRAIPPGEVDLFVVPGVLFDRAGRRLGRGGGHYDRLLGRAREDAVRAGLCYAQRVVRELPAAPWDVPVHVVVTETEVIRPTRVEEGT
jgi:5-formyltetrahydrofolate cyclo-ligase